MAWLPSSILADEGIGEDDELSGDRDEDDFWGFSTGCEALMEGLHFGIEAAGAERGEIENAAHGWASAPR